MKVRDILSNKGNRVYSVSQDVTVYEALKLMAEMNLGGVIVKENNVIAGIFTERDYARKLVLKGKFSKDTLVSEVMHPTPLQTVTEDDEIEECMSLMTVKFIRHLPVMRGDELIGLISIGDVVKFIISEQQYIIANLQNYIAGRNG